MAPNAEMTFPLPVPRSPVAVSSRADCRYRVGSSLHGVEHGRRSTRRWLGWACPWPSESERILIARGTRQWSRNPAAPRPAPPPRPCSLGQRKSRRGTPGDAVGKAMIPGVRLIRIIRADPALPFFQGRRRGARQLQEVRDPLLGEPPDTPGTQSHLFQERVCAEFPPPQWQVCRRHCQHVGLGTTSNCWRPRRRGLAVNQRRRSGTCRYRTPHTRPEARADRFSWSRARRPETESSPGTSGSRFL